MYHNYPAHHLFGITSSTTYRASQRKYAAIGVRSVGGGSSGSHRDR